MKSSKNLRKRALKSLLKKKQKGFKYLLRRNQKDAKKAPLCKIDVQFESINKEPVDVFILRLVREKYGSRVIDQSINWAKNAHVISVRLQIDVKEVLFKFKLTDSHIPFRILRSDVFSINIQIGALNSMEKYNIVENAFQQKIEGGLKGIKNEERGIDIATRFAEKENFKIIYNSILDNKGVDFILIDNLKRKFPFQIKSSWGGVHRAIKKRKIFYYYHSQKIPIIFLVVSMKRTNRDIYNIIRAEIKKQINNNILIYDENLV